MTRSGKNATRSPSAVNNQDAMTTPGRAAAQAAAGVLQSAGRTAKAGATSLREAVVENPTALKLPCMIVGVTLSVISTISLVNLFQAVFSPISYCVTISQLFVGLAILLVETPEERLGNYCGARDWMFRNFGFLGSPIGRAIFYIYVACFMFSTAYEKAFWQFVNYAMGSVLALAGVAQLIVHVKICGWCCRRKESARQHEQHISLDEHESRV